MPHPNEEIVYVYGPVDSTPGKKAKYPIRPLPRRLVEKPEVKALGIGIMPEGYSPEKDGKSIEVENRVVQTRGPGRKSNAEKENEELKKQLEEMRALLEAKNETKTTVDADQA